jgi:tripartite-type tricarboxylate transporter receptor subunit TctC
MWRFDMRCRLAAAIAAVLFLAAPAGAQDWPQRQVSVIVPFAAGGSTDLIARIIAQHMQAKFGQPFVVENKAGAGGSIGTGLVAKAPNDGYTLLVGSVSSNAINGFLYSRLSFDVARDFEPVSLLARLPNLLFVHPKVPAKTVTELVDYLKANEGKVNYGSSGNGTSSHLSSVMFQMASGTKMTHVPFRSTAEVMNSILGGNIDLAIDSMTTAWPHAQAGRVRAIAVTTPQRSATAPDLPTIGETLNGFQATAWQGLFAPAGTPRPIVDKLAAETKRILELPEVVKSLKELGAEPAPSTPDEFAAYTASERARWGEVVRASGVKID